MNKLTLIFTVPQANPNQFILLGMAVVCIAILFLPTEGEESVITWKASINLKLVSCYILGKDFN